VRAMRLSSVIFFSFNSDMVIFTYGRKLWRGLSGRNLAGVKQVQISRERGCRGPKQGRAYAARRCWSWVASGVTADVAAGLSWWKRTRTSLVVS
jgi:hypothetical protein